MQNTNQIYPENSIFPCCRYVDCIDGFGYTALHYATTAGHEQVMQLLMSYGADLIPRTMLMNSELLPHHAHAPGATPLHIASAMGSLSCIKLILRSYVRRGSACCILPAPALTIPALHY